MPDMPPPGLPPASDPTGYPAAPAPPMPWSPAPPAALRKPARWPMFVMLVITLIAVGAAVAAWLRPIPQAPAAAPPKPTYSDQQVADAKSKVCGAFDKLWHVLQVNSTRNGGDDPTAQLVVAVNERQIYVSGSAYLLTTLSDEPATPSELAATVSQLA